MDITLKVRTFKDVYIAQADNTLGASLEHTRSSHDPIFIYKDNEFQGITTPYHAVFKKKYPHNTKVIHTALTPPHISPSASLFDIVDFMLETKSYTLPVFENGKIVGLATASDILKQLTDKEQMLTNILENVTIHKPITANINEKINNIYRMLKEKNISRIILVNETGQLEGVVARRDIQEAFTRPTRKLRYGKNKGHRTRSWSFDEEKIKREEYPIKEFYNIEVAKVEHGTSIKEALTQMLRKNVGSIIFVNEQNRPTGIISTHTFLKAISDIRPKEMTHMTITDKHQVITDLQRTNVEDVLQRFAERLKRRYKILNFETIIDEKRNIKGKINKYEVSMNIELDKHKPLHTKVVNASLIKSTKEALHKIDHQVE